MNFAMIKVILNLYLSIFQCQNYHTMRLKVFTLKGTVAAIFLPSHTSENIGKNNGNLSISVCSAVLSSKYINR